MFEDSCYIRPLTEDDLITVLTWRNHPDVRRNMLTQHEIGLAEHLNWFAKVSQDVSRRLFIIEELKQPIGYVQFSQVVEGGITDWGFYAQPNAPKGTGRKLGTLALNHAFDCLKLHKVCGKAIASNKASIEFHRSLGFMPEGVLRDQLHINGIYHSLHCFGILASEWRSERVI